MTLIQELEALENKWFAVAREMRRAGRGGTANAIERQADALHNVLLRHPAEWVPVAKRLPEEGRRCWVWVRTGNNEEVKRRAIWSAGWTLETQLVRSWIVLLWQYEVVPADPCEVTP